MALDTIKQTNKHYINILLINVNIDDLTAGMQNNCFCNYLKNCMVGVKIDCILIFHSEVLKEVSLLDHRIYQSCLYSNDIRYKPHICVIVVVSV